MTSNAITFNFPSQIVNKIVEAVPKKDAVWGSNVQKSKAKWCDGGENMVIASNFQIDATGKVTVIVSPGAPSDMKGLARSIGNNLERLTVVQHRLRKRLLMRKFALSDEMEEPSFTEEEMWRK